jgi:hypothetical protein
MLLTETITPAQVTSDPEAFARVFLRIYDKQKQLRPLIWNKAQRHFHEHRTGRDLILKARQLGFSTYVQAEMFRRTVTSTRTTITLAHDDDTTGLLRRMADRYYEYCNFNGIQPQRKYANASLATYPEFGSEAIIAKAGSRNVGRGATITDFHGSEVAFWPDAESIIAGAMQAGNPDVILESTPNGSQGYFYEKCAEALRGDGVWKLHFYPWWWDDTYRIELDENEQMQYTSDEIELATRHKLSRGQIGWRRKKLLELGRLFIQEYPEDPISCFLTSGNSYFGDLSGAFTAPLDATYQEGHKYSAGLDFGQSDDYTVLVVLDRTTHQMVDMLRVNKLPWADLRARITAVYKLWHLRSITAERNSIGQVNIEALQAEGVSVNPFETTNTSKAQIMQDLYEELHKDLRLQDLPALRHEMNTFVASQTTMGLWRLAADGTGHDDTVIALALANQTGPGWLEWARMTAQKVQATNDEKTN